MTTLRSELPGDLDAIRRVHELAFGQPGEAGLVDALRGSDAWLPALSVVAEDGSRVVGHALFSLVRLDAGPDLLSLGPMGVLPDRQRAGVGTRLVLWGIERARETDYPLVVVVGHPDYYPRFGFRPARDYGIETPYDVPDEAWMALPLPAYERGVRGTVRYPPAWASV